MTTELTTNTCLQQVPQHCPQLTTFKFDGDLSHDFFVAIHQYGYQFCDLELREWTVEPACLDLLPPSSLKRLCLGFALYPMENVNPDLLPIMKKFTSLTSLAIIDATPVFINSLLRLKTTTCWLHLTHVDFRNGTNTDDATWIRFIMFHPHLQHIELTCFTELTDASLDAMTEWLPFLRRLELYTSANMTSKGIRRFIQRSHQQLEDLTVYWCDGVLARDFPELNGLTGDMLHFDRMVLDKIQQTNRE